MTGSHEKSVHRLAERKGFRLDKVGKGHHRYALINLESGARMASGVPDHEYSFSLDEAEAWLSRPAHQPNS
jgi:hypothetical protein